MEAFEFEEEFNFQEEPGIFWFRRGPVAEGKEIPGMEPLRREVNDKGSVEEFGFSTHQIQITTLNTTSLH